MTTDTRDLEIATEIVRQFGGFGRLKAMVNGRDYVAIERGLMFRFSGSQKANKAIITLEPTDLYKLELYQLRRNGEARMISRWSGLYADQMLEAFRKGTGLHLRI